MIPSCLLTGLVLAGGRASRMSNGNSVAVDKGLLILQGSPLIARAQRYLAPRVGPLLVSANRHIGVYAAYGEVVPDDPALGRCVGPLAGVTTALGRINTPWLMVIPVDVANLPMDLVDRLARAAIEGNAAIVYANSGGAHPLCMLLHRDVLDGLLLYLQGGGRKVHRWQQLNQAKEVIFEESAHAFFNINTPEDLCFARRLTLDDPAQ